jgi:hypothetical protein
MKNIVIVRIENQRYAMLLGMCRDKTTPDLLSDMNCLPVVQTRTHWVWHLYYALLD